MPPQGDFYRYECNVNFRYYYAVSPLRSLERLLKGTENAQSCTLAALLIMPLSLLRQSPQQAKMGITKGPPQMRGSLSIATWWRVSPPADL